MSNIQPAPPQAVQQRKEVRALIESKPFMEQIAKAVPAHVKPEHLLRVALTTVQKTPKLMECDQTSLLASIIECAQLGLMPDGILGHAYLVPYKGKATLQIGYKGLIALARRSGEVEYVVGECVYACDEFDITFAPERKLIHKPNFDDPERGVVEPGKFIPKGLRGVYGVVKLKSGEVDFEYLPLHKLERIRNSAQAGNYDNAPWKTHYEEMARKTGVRALGKRLPLSVDFMRASNLDDYNEQGIETTAATVIESSTVVAEATQMRTQQLADKYAQPKQLEGAVNPPQATAPQGPESSLDLDVPLTEVPLTFGDGE